MNASKRTLAAALAALWTAGCGAANEASTSSSGGCDTPGDDGSCGSGGGGGGAGGPKLLAEGQLFPQSIRADDTTVWWLNEGATTVGGGGLSWDGSLTSLTLAGGEPKVLASGEATPRSLDIDAATATALWVETYQGSGEPSELRALALGGGQPATLATGLGDFVAAGGALFAGTTEGIVRLALPEGGSTVVVQSEYDVTGVAADDEHLYWATGAGALKRVALGGGAPTVIAEGQSSPYGLVARDGVVFWFDAAGNISSSSEGAPPAVVATAPSPASSLALDATHVYIGASDSETTDGAIYRVPLGGGDLETLTAIDGWNPAVAVNETHVFWIDPEDSNWASGAVYSLPK